MDCYLCSNESLTVTAKGVCFECSQGACANPSKRRDRVFHGDVCVCGCRKFVCEADVDEHARRNHGGSTTTCFPQIAAVGSTLTLGVAVSATSGDRALPEGVVELTLTEFLNRIYPGRQTLSREISETPQNLATEGLAFGRTDLTTVYFNKKFFTRDTVIRIASLAAQTLAESWRRMDVSSVVERMAQDKVHSMQRIAELYAGPLESPVWPQRPQEKDESLALAEFFDLALPDVLTLEFLSSVPRYYGHTPLTTWLQAGSRKRRTLQIDDEMELGG